MKGRTEVPGMTLLNFGMRGHFRNAPQAINRDVRFLDVRQMRRFLRAKAKIQMA